MGFELKDSGDTLIGAAENIIGGFSNEVIKYFKITDNAKAQIRILLLKKFDETKKIPVGIRLSLKPKGCSGMKYGIEYAEEGVNISKYDDLMIDDEIKIFIEPKISMWIIGTVMDYTDDGINAGFIFTNPNEKGKCGCGESFYV